MGNPVQSAAEDLAYLRGIVDNDGGQKVSGTLFVAAGLLYSVQLVGHWAEVTGLLQYGPLGGLLLVTVPTLLFVAVMIWALARNRGQRAGSTAKAFNAVFASIGTANLVMVAIFAPAAVRAHDFNIWLFYGAMLFTLQGAGWLTAFGLRREAWMALAAIGWFAAAIVMGVSIGASLATYLLVAAVSMLVLMVGPGLIMLRKPA